MRIITYQSLIKSIITTIIISLAFVVTRELSYGQQVLNANEKIEAEISRLESKGIPFQGKTRLANVYTFEANKGDVVEIDAVRYVNTTSNLALMLVDPNGYETVVDDNLDWGARESIKKQINFGGKWLLFVISKTEGLAKYSLLLTVYPRNDSGEIDEQSKPQ